MATIDMSLKPVFPTKCIFDVAEGITGATKYKVDEVVRAVMAIGLRMDDMYAKYGDTLVGTSIKNSLGQSWVIDSMYNGNIFKIQATNMLMEPQFANETFVVPAEEVTSKVAPAPFHLQIDAIPAGASALVQARIHPDAEWVTIRTYTDADTPSVYVFGGDRFNFVRVVHSGVGDFKAYTQG